MQVSSSSTALVSYDPTLPHISVKAYLNKVTSSALESLQKQVDEVVKKQKGISYSFINDKNIIKERPVKLYVKNFWSDRTYRSGRFDK